jgi:hypothetical protein
VDRPLTAPRRRGRVAVGVGVAAAVALGAGCVAGAGYVRDAVPALDTMTRPHCRTAPESLLDRLAADPVLTTDVPGTRVTDRHRANPCDPGEEERASVTVTRALEPGADWTAVRAHYEALLTAQGWAVATTGEVLCGTRTVDGRVVAFDLRRSAAPADLVAAIRCFGFPRDTSC